MKSYFRAFSVLSLLAGGLSLFSPSVSAMSQRPIAKLSKAPDFSLPLLTDPNKKIRLSELTQNKPVLVAFWASWCPSCVEEIPALNAWYRKFVHEGIEIIGVSVQDEPEAIKRLMTRTPIEFPVLMDPEGKIAEAYGISALPVSIVVAKGGEIIYYGFSLPKHLESFIQKGA